MIHLPIGFPQHGHPNLTKEVLSSLKLSLDGLLEKGEKSLDLGWRDVLVVVYVEFGWLETTVELLKRFGAVSRERDSLSAKSEGVSVVAQMFEVWASFFSFTSISVLLFDGLPFFSFILNESFVKKVQVNN